MAQFTTLIIQSLKDAKAVNPEFSFGELLYTIFRKNNLPSKPDDACTSWLLSISDEDIYNSVEKVIGDSIKEETNE